MLTYVITYCAWLGLLLVVVGLIQMLLKQPANQPPKLFAGRILSPIALIFLSIGTIARADLEVSMPLTIIGAILVLVSIVWMIRYRAV